MGNQYSTKKIDHKIQQCDQQLNELLKSTKSNYQHRAEAPISPLNINAQIEQLKTFRIHLIEQRQIRQHLQIANQISKKIKYWAKRAVIYLTNHNDRAPDHYREDIQNCYDCKIKQIEHIIQVQSEIESINLLLSTHSTRLSEQQQNEINVLKNELLCYKPIIVKLFSSTIPVSISLYESINHSKNIFPYIFDYSYLIDTDKLIFQTANRTMITQYLETIEIDEKRQQRIKQYEREQQEKKIIAMLSQDFSSIASTTSTISTTPNSNNESNNILSTKLKPTCDDHDSFQNNCTENTSLLQK
jgi:hypothetical protein